MTRRTILIGAILLACFMAATVVVRRTGQPVTKSLEPSVHADRPAFPGSPSYVGEKACAECHAAEHERWGRSHHAVAMQPATPQTVLGDFEQASLTHGGVTTTFFRQNGFFRVRTEGPDGGPAEFDIAYAFGATPLQQYLIPLLRGRYQPFSIAWDTRPTKNGGQQWFSLSPTEKIPPGDPLHWTSRLQTWNYACAECHSTNLRKHYDLQRDSYGTTWTDVNVSCEACHGPGSRHVEWAKASDRRGPSSNNKEGKGLTVVSAADREAWVPDPATGIAKRRKPLASDVELQTCARCHSRRSVIHEAYEHGKSLLDTHLPALLDTHLYHDDGQIREEVYEYGSFLQSKMYRAGVTCSDCHEPHALELRKPGNALCARCHVPAKFDTRRHHFHPKESTGAQCTACHMPAQVYMVVDPRRDHSFRIPRPDLSVKLGTPNACTQCHRDRTPQWAAGVVKRWYGKHRRKGPHFGEALHALRTGQPNAIAALAAIIRDLTQPAIARATALSELHRSSSPIRMDLLKQGLADADPLVRLGALRGMQGLDPAARLALAGPMVSDPIRAVRIEAARVLAPAPRAALTGPQQAALSQASIEYIDAQLATGEVPASHLNLGIFYAERFDWGDAESAYRTALRLDPNFVPALVNLADLYRIKNEDEKGEPLLREALEREPKNADAHEALGLWLVRQDRKAEALPHFERASRLEPDSSRHSYVYGIALQSLNQTDRAVRVLEGAVRRHPGDKQILQALIAIHRDRRAYDKALRYANRLAALDPDDPAAQRLLADVRDQTSE
jgi:tetratricopeptide (TPR) repeat protein